MRYAKACMVPDRTTAPFLRNPCAISAFAAEYLVSTMNNDGDLLRQFAETRDESCFATVVQRHLGFVYAVSLRRLRNVHAAQDAAQAVFVALARKAGAVARGPSV